ncbi:MAG: hypothetical protein JNJ59_04730 [Deltaproteobacteria bacterium]|jgi:hypothetical protein|nr:hypothetical protein [Deltaproteobacteria bacterium]
MRSFALALVSTLSLAALAPATLAASPEPTGPRQQFVIFDQLTFNGGLPKPSIDLTNPRRAASFGRLLELKKDLLAGLGATLKDRSLK